MSTKNRESSSSDDGYNSDQQTRQLQKYNIARDTSIFKKKYHVQELISNSANGVIYSGIEVNTGREVVIKQVPKLKINSYVNVDGRPVPKEFHVHRLASSIEGVVEAFEWFERRTTWVLVMEKPANCIDLFDFVGQYGTLSEEYALLIIRSVVKTCLKMFESGMFHRDIKDENILFNPSTLETLIIDFGCATQTSSRQQRFRNFAGTPDYIAPEYYSTGIIDQEKSTVWSIGCLLYILLLGEQPFNSKDQIIQGVLKMDIVQLSQNVVKLLQGMMVINPNNRLSFTEILSRF